MSMHNLFSMLRLPTRQTKGKEPLVDYSQSHVVTYDQYLDRMWKMAMDKAIVGENQRTQTKGEGGKNTKEKQMWSLQWIKWLKKVVEKQVKIQFVLTEIHDPHELGDQVYQRITINRIK